ncbi:MAG: hypothetical protein H0U42_00840 [Thermoleophilaceae bacterium]|nr:hypothetical protein [Thermoleophilaceae bacterium]
MDILIVIALVIAAGRVAIGLALLLAPGRAGVSWLGPSVAGGSPAIAVRLLGVRDAALGGGLIAAAVTDQSIVLWLLAGVLADATDGIVCMTSGSELNRRTRIGTVVVAGGSAAAGIVLAWLICQA